MASTALSATVAAGGESVGEVNSATTGVKKPHRASALGREYGDSPNHSLKEAATSESCTGLEALADCCCKTPQLQRIRHLQDRVRHHIAAEKQYCSERDAANRLCQSLKEKLDEWSQAASYFEEERIKLNGQILKTEHERNRAIEETRVKQNVIKAMKERLQSREGDVKAEVQTADELGIELTHAEARVRQVEGWVEEQKKKTEEMAKAKIQTEQEKNAAVRRVNELEVELIEARHNDTALRELQFEKKSIQQQLKTSQDNLKALEAEYKRLFKIQNAQPRYKVLSDRMTELLKENGELNRELDQLRCQANGQINELHQDKNNVNEELHRATQELTQAKSAVADLRAANAMLKNELTVTKRDTKDLRLKLEEEQKRAKEAAASHQLTADHYKGLLTKA